MIEIIDLKPKPSPTYPRCEADRNQKWRTDIKGVPNQCLRGATITIDGKAMCRPHAGQVALKMLLEGKIK